VIAANILLPIVGIVVGGWLTYYLNVRQRRRNYVEDLFQRATEAVYAADASVHYTWVQQKPPALSDEAWKELSDWFTVQAMQQWWTRQAEANTALARIRAHRPEIAAFLPVQFDQEGYGLPPVLDLLADGPPDRDRRFMRFITKRRT